MERPQEAEFIRREQFDPADALHVTENGLEAFYVMDVDLPEQGRVAITSEVREAGHQKVLAEDEFFDGFTLI
jgi:hypothetical protein